MRCCTQKLNIYCGVNDLIAVIFCGLYNLYVLLLRKTRRIKECKQRQVGSELGYYIRMERHVYIIIILCNVTCSCHDYN
jgi:hypothetical protein